MSGSSFVSVYLISWYEPRLQTDLSAAERTVRTLKLDHELVYQSSQVLRVGSWSYWIKQCATNLQANDLIQDKPDARRCSKSAACI